MPVKTFFNTADDMILIEDLEVLCRVGHTASERSFPQVVLLTLSIELPLGEAGHRDNMRHTVDYAEVITRLKTRLQKNQFVLIEAVAEAAAQIALSYPSVQGVTVKATKKVFEGIRAVGVIITRQK